jgi:dienelactone hydrolase
MSTDAIGIRPTSDEAYRNRILGLVATLTPERIQTDTAAALGFLASHERVKGSKAGVVGYCMGGAAAVRMMAGFPDQIAAAASYHGGRLATDARPGHPHARRSHRAAGGGLEGGGRQAPVRALHGRAPWVRGGGLAGL